MLPNSIYGKSTNQTLKIPSTKVKLWVEKFFPDVRSRKNGEELVICNPFDGDAGYHMNINPEKLGVHDWRGNSWAGPVNTVTNKRNCSFVKFVTLFRKCSYNEAIKEVLDTTDDISGYLNSNKNINDKQLELISVSLPSGLERLSDSSTDDRQAVILKKWLKSRGYTENDITNENLHFGGLDVYWLYYEFDELVYWQSRNRLNKVYRFPNLNITNKDGNVIGKTDGSKGDFLYGFDQCESASFLIVTESIFSKHSLGSQVLASGGASLTQIQVDKIRMIGPVKGIILSPDNDKAGLQSIISNHRLLKPLGYPIFYSIPPKSKFIIDDIEKKTKDWNELFEHCKITTTEIRAIHDINIKKLNVQNLVQLDAIISSFK